MTCADILDYLEKAKSELDEIEFSDDHMERLKEKLYDGSATRSDITRITQRLGDAIGKVYGWSFPSPGRSQDLSR